MYTPRTAAEAWRLVTLAQRAEDVLRQGYTFWKDTDLDRTAVCKPGSLLAVYWIEEGRCTCPARDKEPTCKHEIAAEMAEEYPSLMCPMAYHGPKPAEVTAWEQAFPDTLWEYGAFKQWERREQERRNAEDYEFGCLPC